MENREVSRRTFLKWSTAAMGAMGAASLVSCSSDQGSDGPAPQGGEPGIPTIEESGVWKSGACYNNCTNGTGRCLVRVYMEDGVPLKIRSDESEEDSFANPQRRSCLRGRTRISWVMSPSRIKYPMKRKNWSPEEPHGELRGIDEWERISWEEALDYVADGIRRTLDEYGPRGILCAASSNAGHYFDPNVCLLNALGGTVHHEAGTVSFGSWPVADTHILGGVGYSFCPHHLQLAESDLHVMFACNWSSNKSSVDAWYLQQCREKGAKIIAIEPWLSQTASALADEWVPILPGTDTALMIAIAHEWIVEGTYDQEFLDTYCSGFDGEHMPEGAPANASWKDYVMGTGYDMVEKTPEWACDICGVPADRIRELAAEIASVDKVHFHCGQSVTKIPAGEQVVQAFYTMALMHGGIGTPGHYMEWGGCKDGSSGTVNPGNFNPTDIDPANPLQPNGAPVYMFYPIPNFQTLEDPQGWLNLEPSECWRSILDGQYGRDCWPGGKMPIDIHQIYYGGWMSTLNQIPDVNSGIKATRQMDFVWGMNPFFDSSRQYCDVVLPCSTWWEQYNRALSGSGPVCLWDDRLLEPLYESKPDSWVAEELAKRLGVDFKEMYPLSDEERCYATVCDALYKDSPLDEGEPLLSITQEEIDELFPNVPDAAPQEGRYSFAEFREKGILKYPFTGDETIGEPFGSFIADPVGNPLKTASGKFEIYCPSLVQAIEAVGYTPIAPIGMWNVADPEQGAGTQTEEYPLLLWTPHSLGNAHSVNDSVTSLREAYPQECFISSVDAEARGIQTGDPVLMTSPHGKVLRPAKVMPTIVPGAVALQDGSWFRIDEETGIDMGGCPNVLQAPHSSGGGCQAWTGTLVQVEKYDGELELVPDKECPVVTPVGIE